MDRILKDSEKRKWPRASSAPALELSTIIFKHVNWYMQQISGERLQDHWSSGLSVTFPIGVHLVFSFCSRFSVILFPWISNRWAAYCICEFSSLIHRGVYFLSVMIHRLVRVEIHHEDQPTNSMFWT